MNFGLILCSSILIGSISAYLAYRRGRSPYFWFFMGFVFGILGIMAIFLAPIQRREPEAGKPIPQPYIDGPSDRFWYYLDGERQQKGPMSHNAITQAWKKGEVAPSTLVWHEDLSSWTQLQELIRHREQEKV